MISHVAKPRISVETLVTCTYRTFRRIPALRTPVTCKRGGGQNQGRQCRRNSPVAHAAMLRQILKRAPKLPKSVVSPETGRTSACDEQLEIGCISGGNHLCPAHRLAG